MNRRILLITVAMCGLGFLGEVQASLFSQKIVQFYAGLSGGLNTTTGHRSERVFNATIPETFVFSDQARLRSTNFQCSLYGGSVWNVPQTSFFLGPEVYLGRSDTEMDLRQFIFDPNTNFNRVVTSSFSQSIFFGGGLKAGYTFDKYSAYILFGQEISRFQNRVAYVPESNGGGIADDSPGLFNSRKWLNGLFFGLGLEKQVNCVRFGMNFRIINYRRFNPTFSYPIKDESIINSFNFKNTRLSLTLSYHF